MSRLFKLIVALLTIAVASDTEAQTLFTYGKKAVSRAEFLKAFSKNNTEAAPDLKTYRDYLELYTRFKLKVQAALDARMDTLPGQVAELNTFRSQVAASYMNDEASTNLLIEEAIARSTKDIQIAHIYISLSPEASAKEEQAAIVKINTAHARLLKGEDFGKVAAELSEDPEAKTNKGVIGYITGFVLPYDLETLAYTTPPGKFSKPFRSKIGYHIFKNTGERKSPGRIRIAQILLSYPPDASSAQKQLVADKADSLYKVIQAGGDFRQLAAQFSNDNLSYQNGGELQEFGTGKYEPDFEKAAFSLKADGEISKPFSTSYGYHIIKRIELKPLALDKNNRAVWENFRQQVIQSDRMEVSKKILLKKVLQQTALKKAPVDPVAFKKFSSDALEGKGAVYGKLKPGTPLFSFPKQTVTLGEWARYIESLNNIETLKKGKSITQLYDQFVETSALEYYKEHLEEYNKEFAYQLNEFREGNLLFEIMQRRIWEAASADTTGLKNYYSQHKDKYWWEQSADAWIITASNDSIARSVIGKSPAAGDWRKLIDLSEGGLMGDSGRFELGQLPVVDRTAFSKGLITAPVKNESDNSVTFCYIVQLYNNREPRSFNDAKGFVINDYQGFLEEKWIAELRKKYPVRIDETVVNGLMKK